MLPYALPLVSAYIEYSFIASSDEITRSDMVVSLDVRTSWSVTAANPKIIVDRAARIRMVSKRVMPSCLVR